MLKLETDLDLQKKSYGTNLINRFQSLMQGQIMNHPVMEAGVLNVKMREDEGAEEYEKTKNQN